MILDVITNSNTSRLLRMSSFLLMFSCIIISCTPSYEDLKGVIEDGNMELLRKYIENNIDLNNNSEGPYPLLVALNNSDIEICKILIENGADVNIKNEKGDSLLFIAYQKKEIEIARLLLESGADVNVAIDNEKSLLSLSYENKDFDFVRLFIDMGADVNVLTGEKNKKRPLIFDAIESKNESLTLNILQSKNLIKDSVDYDGYGIILYSVLYSSIDLFQEIINHDIPVDMIDKDGETPLVVALDMGYIEKAKILINSGAIIKNYRFTWSMLVEHWNLGASEIAEIYLEKNIPIDSDSDDPILTCVLYANVEAMRWFLEHGFSPNRENQYGETPIDFVWRIGLDVENIGKDDLESMTIQKQMYSLLREYGARLN